MLLDLAVLLNFFSRVNSHKQARKSGGHDVGRFNRTDSTFISSYLPVTFLCSTIPRTGTLYILRCWITTHPQLRSAHVLNIFLTFIFSSLFLQVTFVFGS